MHLLSKQQTAIAIENNATTSKSKKETITIRYVLTIRKNSANYYSFNCQYQTLVMVLHNQSIRHILATK